MMNESQARQLYHRLGLSDRAQQLIEQIRAAPPSRRVPAGVKRVPVRYPSRKMGVTIQAGTHRIGFAGIYEMERDPDVLEYYDQPSEIKLTYQLPNGRPNAVLYTPDFFVIRANSAGWEEWQSKDYLPNLAQKMPYRYEKQDGGWRCPPGEQYAEQFGLYYRVRSSAEINWILQRNWGFLEDYLRDKRPQVGQEARQEIRSLVAAQPGIHLDELLKRAERFSSDDIYVLIAAEVIYVDLCRYALAEPDQVPVFGDAETARAYDLAAQTMVLVEAGAPRTVEVVPGATVTWDGKPWTIINPGETIITLLGADDRAIELPNAQFEGLVKQGKITGLADVQSGAHPKVQELLAQASPDDRAVANHRYRVVAAVLAGEEPDEEALLLASPKHDGKVSKRTIRRWVQQFRQAEREYGCGYVGLLPFYRQRGRRGSHLPEATQQAVEKFIDEQYETNKQQGKGAVHALLVKACEEQGVIPPSYTAFSDALKRRPRYEQVLSRRGRRAAYADEPFYWDLELKTPRHGDRPFEIGHIDHTELDIELVSRKGRNLGRPWVTFLVDAYSRRILAIYLTFDPPSYRSCMMVLRECVRRHGRLPQIIVVDGGKEFQSHYFETLLACYEVTKKTRPAAKARFGSVCERLFGTTNTQFIHNLAGNTQITRDARQITDAVDPKKHAVWSIGRLYTYLCRYVYEVYDTLDHPAIEQSPKKAFETGLVLGGKRPQRLIPYDRDFVILTLPSTPKGKAKVQPNHGVKINYLYYWDEALRAPNVANTLVPVRYDPFDIGIAYAFVGGRWVRCLSEHHGVFQGRTEREIKLATAELLKQNRAHAQGRAITARRLADFLASAEAEEALLEQRLRDSEGKDVQTLMAGTPLHPEQPMPLLAGSTAEPADQEPDSGHEDEEEVDIDELEVYGDY